MNFTTIELENFVRESNKIEGILRRPSDIELGATKVFFSLPEIQVGNLVTLIDFIQPGARLRDRIGLDVRVGNYTPPPGGQFVREGLENLLVNMTSALEYWTPYKVHEAYETLHPFTDGNGRSGRALWAWQMLHFDIWPGLQLGFLHAYYYQTLEASNGQKDNPNELYPSDVEP